MYAQVFLECWPTAARDLNLSNEATIGDMIEALLGFHWCRKAKGHAVPDITEDIVQRLETICLTCWLLHLQS